MTRKTVTKRLKAKAKAKAEEAKAKALREEELGRQFGSFVPYEMPVNTACCVVDDCPCGMNVRLLKYQEPPKVDPEKEAFAQRAFKELAGILKGLPDSVLQPPGPLRQDHLIQIRDNALHRAEMKAEEKADYAAMNYSMRKELDTGVRTTIEEEDRERRRVLGVEIKKVRDIYG